MKKFFLPAALISILLSGCSSIYQKYTLTDGYSDYRYSEQQFRILFPCSQLTHHDDAYLFFLSRGAELALENGYRYFYITELTTVHSGNLYSGNGLLFASVLDFTPETYIGQNNPQNPDYPIPLKLNFSKPSFEGNILLVEQGIEGEAAPFDAEDIIKKGKNKSNLIAAGNTAGWIAGSIGLIAAILLVF